MLDQVDVCEWKVVRATYARLLEEMDAWRRGGGKRRFVCFADANGLSLAWRRDPVLRAAYRRADAVCADGIAVAALARLNGGDGHRLTGPELFARALEYGVSRGWRHYFCGTDEATLAALRANAERRWPGVRIVGTFAPEFADDPKPPPVEAGTVDFLWVALGCPKQEKWCARHLGELAASVVLPVGAAFDFLAGTAREAPRPLRALGLNWLWRLLTGGRRVFVRNVRCVLSSLAILVGEGWRRLMKKSGSSHVKVLFLGRREALADCAAAVAAAEAAGLAAATREIDPAALGSGLFGRLWARRRLRRAAADAGEEGVLLLVERPGDAAWRPWMAYAAGVGLRPIAVPARLKGVENIAGVRSGVAVYDSLKTAADVALACRAARAEAQALVAVARF